MSRTTNRTDSMAINDAAKGGYSVEKAVLERYQAGAKQVEAALCCPITDYDGQYLKILPDEILEKDYGCGDPSVYVNEGDTVVDLGSGAGKICYILAQKVGRNGKVIGVDFNDEMLGLARKYQQEIADQIGYHNTQFVKGRIQDLALDLNKVESHLVDHPVTNMDDVLAYEAECDRLRKDEPMISDGTVDAVVSNCVLNLVRTDQKKQLFDEIFRVLRKGGRAIISDIVCDETPTSRIINDPDLWSGCIAGAFREDEFLKMFEDAGFHGVEILARAEEPWHVIDGIEFRSMTVRAYKGKQGPCLERNQAVIYKGPWKKVVDDDGHTLIRGERMAVCDKTYNLYSDPTGPYGGTIIGLQPMNIIPLDDAQPMSCHGKPTRTPREMKGEDYDLTQMSGEDCCGPDGNCC